MTLTTHRANRHLPPRSLLERLVFHISEHWWGIAMSMAALYIGLPWLAPVFMRLGWSDVGNVIYLLYAPQCHQLPQRSFFLFGPKLTYSLQEIQAAWVVTEDTKILRQFVGNPQMGWKVAWSDRMVALYTSAFFTALICWPLRTWLRPLPVRIFILLALPMVLDGTTHVLSDYISVMGDFRATNSWLMTLTQNTLPPTFYAGDALGSFNSWMRLLTGSIFGISAVWLLSSYLAQQFTRHRV